jgi:hypothetical protein
METIDTVKRAECVECPWTGDYGREIMALVEALEHFSETGHYAKVVEAAQP